MMQSVKSINPFKSVIQTSYDVRTAHGRGLKVDTKEGKGSVFITQRPIN